MSDLGDEPTTSQSTVRKSAGTEDWRISNVDSSSSGNEKDRSEDEYLPPGMKKTFKPRGIMAYKASMQQKRALVHMPKSRPLSQKLYFKRSQKIKFGI